MFHYIPTGTSLLGQKDEKKQHQGYPWLMLNNSLWIHIYIDIDIDMYICIAFRKRERNLEYINIKQK